MLFHSMMNSDSNDYFTQITYRLHGQLDVEAVEKSMNDLLDRYDILRTNILSDGFKEPVQIVLKERKIQFQFIDIRGSYEEEKKDEIIPMLHQANKDKRFDLENDVLIRLTVYQVKDNAFEFIWSNHHILIDGWSMALIIKDYQELYEINKSNISAELPEVSPYSTFIDWLQKKDKSESTKYWNNYLGGYSGNVSIPKKSGAGSKTKNVQHTVDFALERDHTRFLQKQANEYGVTLSTMFQVAWGILLSKYNNKNDVVFGSVFSGRPSEVHDIEEMVGLFINTLPVRIKYNEEQDLEDLMVEVQNQFIEIEEHSYYALSDIQNENNGGSEFFDHIIVFENYPISERISERSKYRVSDLKVFEQAHYGLTVIVIPGDELEVTLKYDIERYDKETINQVAVHLKEILNFIVSNQSVSS